MDRAPFFAQADCKPHRSLQGTLDDCGRRCHAGFRQLRLVRTGGLDARRLSDCLRPHAPGRHRDPLPERPLSPHSISSSAPIATSLPETADDFLWSRETVFNKLGRFPGMSDEMGYIAVHALADYPLWQAEEALTGHRRADAQSRNWRKHRPSDADAYLRHFPGVSAATIETAWTRRASRRATSPSARST